jgi:hypothetical protein
MALSPEQTALSFFLPDGTLNLFDIVSSQRGESELRITLEERNNPPLEERHQGLPVESRGFKDITITDFSARGRKTFLTFRRRSWRVGTEVLKRKIELCAEGTRLEREFGDFLKNDRRHPANCTCDNSQCKLATPQGFRSPLP